MKLSEFIPRAMAEIALGLVNTEATFGVEGVTINEDDVSASPVGVEMDLAIVAGKDEIHVMEPEFTAKIEPENLSRVRFCVRLKD